MNTQPNFKPAQYHTATPYLTVRGAARALAFYQQAFGAKELFRIDDSEGRVGHAEIQIGDSIIMLSDEYPDMGSVGPETLGGTAVSLLIYVEDCDAVYDRAVKAGAHPTRPLQNMFYGDRSGTVKDPFGHQWLIATHVEDVAPEELMRRARAAMGQTQAA
ncbi:MAG TPA: VOC family protein [Opitutaceae bacterium]|nr:VOC family protein [Opitutaceae bacterium]